MAIAVYLVGSKLCIVDGLQISVGKSQPKINSTCENIIQPIRLYHRRDRVTLVQCTKHSWSQSDFLVKATSRFCQSGGKRVRGE